MKKTGCFNIFRFAWKRKTKVAPKGTDTNSSNDTENVRIKFQDFVEQKSLLSNVEVGRNDKHDNLLQTPVLKEEAYDRNDEHNDILSFTTDCSDSNSKELAALEKNDIIENNNCIIPEELILSSHDSDPGIYREKAFSRSPVLKRSSSNIETKISNKILSEFSNNSNSFDDLLNLTQEGIPGSRLSVSSADKVLIKRSSNLVLPLRSNKLSLELFLQSCRDIPKTANSVTDMTTNTSNVQVCDNSDMLETKEYADTKKKKVIEEQEDILHPQSYWITFSHKFDRVNAWVDSIETANISKLEVDGANDDVKEPEEAKTYITSAEIGECSRKNIRSRSRLKLEEFSQANNIVKLMNSHSSETRIVEMGLKVIPMMSGYASLRSVNLSGNAIAYISPGSLPKNLHVLDLSRNNITKIEGLKELTRLRILNLSHNRISRIGQGLSNCTLIKVLNLAGNKISDVEGLHRLLKLTVLDLSFNKLTTVKSLHQLATNYKSVLTLNLLGNPIEKIIGNEQLKNTVTCLLPQLIYLNKQHVKPQRQMKSALGHDNSGSRTTRQRSYVGGQGSANGQKNRRKISRK